MLQSPPLQPVSRQQTILHREPRRCSLWTRGSPAVQSSVAAGARVRPVKKALYTDFAVYMPAMVSFHVILSPRSPRLTSPNKSHRSKNSVIAWTEGAPLISAIHLFPSNALAILRYLAAGRTNVIRLGAIRSTIFPSSHLSDLNLLCFLCKKGKPPLLPLQ